jgi:ATP-dependent DNA helicase RecQ
MTTTETYDLDTGLARLGYTEFRPGQREAIETLLRQGRLLLVAPTGGGKSLVFQLPATLLPRPTLVVSPLVALMQDQVHALAARGVAVTFLSATLEADEVRRRMGAIADGVVRLVYVAPERLAFPGFRGLVREVAPSLVAIDEAHCISEWGHDFRPDYLQIGDVLAELRAPRVLACTATATPVVRDEILARLGLPADTPQVVRGFARPNLILRAQDVVGARDRATAVDALLREALGAPGAGRGLAIVYTPTRRGAEEEAARLTQRGWRAGVYHAGLDAAARDGAQRAFREGRLEVVAATVAFGMGIDRPDVRAVAHLAPPGSLEAYYQEVGRAGRDGAPAWGLMLVSPGDLALRRRLLERTEGITPAVLEHKWGLFLELLRWAEGGSCRHDAILRYFGDEAETLAGCGRCDNCQRLGEGGEPDQADADTVTLVVRKALSGVARVHGRFGLLAAVALLRGDSDERLLRAGLADTSTFGVLRAHPAEWLQRLLRRCITAGWVDITAEDRPLVRLTEAGRAVMKGQRPARLLLPPAASRATRRRGSGLRSSPVAGRPPAGAGALREPAVDAALFEALRRHRLEVARQHRVPPYVVASDRSLHEMVAMRPRSPADLAGVFGIGQARTDKYGAGFLAVIASVPDGPGAAG